MTSEFDVKLKLSLFQGYKTNSPMLVVPHLCFLKYLKILTVQKMYLAVICISNVFLLVYNFLLTFYGRLFCCSTLFAPYPIRGFYIFSCWPVMPPIQGKSQHPSPLMYTWWMVTNIFTKWDHVIQFSGFFFFAWRNITGFYQLSCSFPFATRMACPKERLFLQPRSSRSTATKK